MMRTELPNLLSTVDPADPAGDYHRLGLVRWSDDELVGAVSACLARPKVAPADSFVLHAPLELLARAALLDLLPIDRREAARIGLTRLVATYTAAGEELASPAALADEGPSLVERAGRVEAAMTAGDLDAVDRLAGPLLAAATADELRTLLAPWVTASLAAAAHGSIALNLLGRAGTAAAVGADVLRGPLRELARNPDWRLHWFDDPSEPVAAPVNLREALLDVPYLGVPESSFIYPLMHQAEESGLARQLLAGVAEPATDVAAAARDLLRVAAWSMVQEGPAHAPYGWSHCLTLPQAVLAVAARGAASPGVAVAVAATHVLGFRAALGHQPLDPHWAPPAPQTGDLDAAIAAGPGEAAAFAWAAAQAAGGSELLRCLAERASAHDDAHLVKYTLACHDAVGSDPAAAPLYLAAAASLRAWWWAHDGAAQPM